MASGELAATICADRCESVPSSIRCWLTQWRDGSIIPRYGAAGVAKFAFLMRDGFPDTMERGGSEGIDGPAIFPTAWFSQRENAIAWFQKK